MVDLYTGREDGDGFLLQFQYEIPFFRLRLRGRVKIISVSIVLMGENVSFLLNA